MTASLEHLVHSRVIDDPDDDIRASALRHIASLAPQLSDFQRVTIVDRVVARAIGYGPLDALMADPTITEILVNGGRQIWIERHGALHRLAISLEPGEAEHLVQRIVAPLGLRADRSSPIVDARLPDGARVHIVLPPVATDGPCLSIRRFATNTVDLAAFASNNIIDVLDAAVRRRCNIVVSGATSSGKTTLLNCLAGRVAANERIVTIEDAAELSLPGDHVVRLEARRPTADGIGEVTVHDLVRAALRMRPDRIVVGEIRGAEAVDMVAALSTGHDGSMTTCHANSALDAVSRIESMMLGANQQVPHDIVRRNIHAAIDLVVHVVRGTRGHRRIADIVELSADPRATPNAIHLVRDGVVVSTPARGRAA